MKTRITLAMSALLVAVVYFAAGHRNTLNRPTDFRDAPRALDGLPGSDGVKTAIPAPKAEPVLKETVPAAQAGQASIPCVSPDGKSFDLSLPESVVGGTGFQAALTVYKDNGDPMGPGEAIEMSCGGNQAGKENKQRCFKHSDCSSSERCVNGQCMKTTSCLNERDCPSFQKCTTGRFCVPKNTPINSITACTNFAQCHPGNKCVNGNCMGQF
jgi:hypothetical protein